MKVTNLTPFFALLALSPALQADEASLGRLFYTPQQRARLDALRQHYPALLTTSSTTFDGEVRRSSGQDTHWLNAQALPGQRPQQSQLAVGDRLDHQSGEVRSLLGDTQLHRH